ncbi:hypothetical protein MYX65_06525 [Acidobacteria bacterium AH-259-L09]|nr:hypothetical protein [Acidobacteria bacterium AH-259-L09]
MSILIIVLLGYVGVVQFGPIWGEGFQPNVSLTSIETMTGWLFSAPTVPLVSHSPPPPPPPPPEEEEEEPPPPPPDEDNDGVGNSLEDRAPNNGDGNNDGIPDSQQANVASFPNSVNSEFVTLASPEGTSLTEVSAIDNPSLENTPWEASFPVGFFEFRVKGVGPAQSTTVTILLARIARVNTYWRFGPTPDKPTPHWYEFLFDGTTGAEILSGGVVVHFVDGGRGDGDLTINGQIQDPGAPAYATPAVVPASVEMNGASPVLKMALQTLANTFVGMAIVNPNNSPNEISLSLVDSSGIEVTRLDLKEPVSAKGQTAFLAREVFESVQPDMSIIVRGRQGPIQSFFLIGDNSQRRLDGLAGEFKASKQLDFPIVHQGSEVSTIFFVFNPDIEESPEVAFQLFNQKGELIKKVFLLAISSNGFVIRTLEDLFGSVGVVQNGYVSVESDIPLMGFEFLAGPDDFSALAAQKGELAGELFVPHFFVDNQGGTTEIRLLNRDASAGVGVRLKAFDESSNLLAIKEFEVTPGALFVGDIQELLDLDTARLQQSEAISGYLQLELVSLSPAAKLFGTSANVSGAVSFTGNEGKFRSTLPMIKSGRTATTFLQVAQSDKVGMFTGLAILNTTSETATVTVRAFHARGYQTAETQFELAARNRVVDLLNGEKFFGAKFSQIGGHLQVSSSVPVVSFALFGDFKSEFLSAIEGQSGRPSE